MVALTDESGVICAQGCVTGFTSVHNRPVPPGHLSVVVTSKVDGKQVSPPCPGPFDGSIVEVGEFHAWRLSKICF